MSKRAIGTGLTVSTGPWRHLLLLARAAAWKHFLSNFLSLLLPKSPSYCLRSSGFQGEDGFYILRKYLLKAQRTALKRGFSFGFFSLVKPPGKRESGKTHLSLLSFSSSVLSPPPPGSICAAAKRKTPQFLNQHDLKSTHEAVV